jgi:hypothetical protein
MLSRHQRTTGHVLAAYTGSALKVPVMLLCAPFKGARKQLASHEITALKNKKDYKMYRRLLLSFLLFIPHTSGLSADYQDQDQFTGKRFYETGEWGGFKGLNELDDGVYLSIVPLQVQHSDETKEYKLKMQWEGPFLDFVDWRPQLILLIDGEKITLKPDGSISHLIETPQLDRGDIMERAEFPTTFEVIKQIANAKSVRVAVYTARGRLERSFNNKNKKIFREFVTNVMEKK